MKHITDNSGAKEHNARHLLTVASLSPGEIRNLIRRAVKLKKHYRSGFPYRPAIGKILGLLFEKPSTRTRISFESAMFQLGGQVSFMSSRDLQLRRGEPLEDTARVLSRYLDCLVVRTFGQEVVETLAEWSDIPVINGLTNQHHPCQILSDVMTVMEHKGQDLGSLKIAWVGDGNNVAHSWIEAAGKLGFNLSLACPEGYEPDPDILARAREEAGGKITVVRSPEEALKDTDAVNVDVWASMGQEEEAGRRMEIFAPYQLNREMLGHAGAEAIVLHCLPAHRGEEITEDVLEGPRSVVWDQAENKMHIHRAVLEWAMRLDGVSAEERRQDEQ
ncbi:MAG TPA: ornithine carbamoyltransferase [Thermodesulfobacteriaceae bacterium]|nr:ornithine carbamoyltransferase [Thermodesulfobacteriaceae bacterium]